MHLNKNNLLQIYEFYVNVCDSFNLTYSYSLVYTKDYGVYKNNYHVYTNITRNAHLLNLPLLPDFQKVGIGWMNHHDHGHGKHLLFLRCGCLCLYTFSLLKRNCRENSDLFFGQLSVVRQTCCSKCYDCLCDYEINWKRFQRFFEKTTCNFIESRRQRDINNKLTNGTAKEIMCILVVEFNSKILYRCFLNAYNTRTQFWSVSPLSIFKLSSIRIRITNINIARKPYFLIFIHGHPH